MPDATWRTLQIAALVVENTFTSVEDMVSRVVPPLGLLIGAGRPCNFLVTNKWTNLAELPKVTKLPMLMFISMRVSAYVPSACYVRA